MKLFFDARYIRPDGLHDGISRYTTELGNALAGLTAVTFLISDVTQLRLLPPDSKYILLHAVTSLKEPFTALVLNKHQPDVVVSPLQTMGSLGRKFKLILTLHDIFYYQFPTPPPQFAWYIRLGWRLYHATKIPGRLVLNSADIVATVSETSKLSIEKLKLTKRPIIVVSNAARDLSEYLDQPLTLTKKPPKNLIYMGAFIPYKNVETLIKALEFLSGRTLHLLSRITPEHQRELKQLIPKGSNVVFHSGVSDEVYAKLLADDAIMVSASKAEGYGLPLAEALRLGVPAVVSDIPIFHEVAEQGALFADPNDSHDFADKIKSLDKVSVREKLVEVGKQHIDTFSWKKSARVLLESVEKLAKS